MKLYHETHGCSLAVDIVARELGIPLEIVWVDMTAKRLPDGSDFHKINPKGQVPTLELPDGRLLTEGAVIMQYLSEQWSRNDLIGPAGSFERYQILEWMSFIASDLHKGGFMPLFKKTTPADYRQIARGHILGRLSWLNDQLADRQFLTGSTFTAADAHCYTIVMWTKRHDIDVSPWPHLKAYLARIGSRPTVAAAEESQRIEEQREVAARARDTMKKVS